ncbi:SigE family RNA polymerase sigma factor [Actinokineospora auranticolor]|uniref:RNA polymerase sigma-70 factor (Sigma-E family) n=1 Tax=Actinokineospora auranticolor TaxID=155976 RepID=A0A2S6GXJ0_9PSEU|nr:SigE family RNA polymerase sigma factor [Actinokineospora auranticolor]PPK69881.1 RNA polymerase sigma-70 factor (sigma-E family) [Actinokineospora auranticolor]
MPDSFEDFARARTGVLLRYATALTCDPHQAQDVVQNVLLRAQQRWASISRLEAPVAYVNRMVTNEFLSWRRRRAASDVMVPHGGMEGLSPPLADPTPAVDERQAVFSGIARLPRKQRAAIVLRYYANQTFAEIADELGCSEATARSHVSRALAALRADAARLDHVMETL